MDIYYLCPPDTKIVRPIANHMGASRRVGVRGRADWYAARLRALQHAAEAGTRYALIVAGHCNVVRRPRGGPVSPCSDALDAGLVIYVDRLLRQHAGVVMVPPVTLPRPQHMMDFLPVLPMVSAYSVVAALASLEAGGPGLEYDLVCQGYRAITIEDYAYECFGGPTLDTHGTARSWLKAHQAAMKEFL